MRKIIKLEPAIPALPKRKKVAAYARVSMESEKSGMGICRSIR